MVNPQDVPPVIGLGLIAHFGMPVDTAIPSFHCDHLVVEFAEPVRPAMN